MNPGHALFLNLSTILCALFASCHDAEAQLAQKYDYSRNRYQSLYYGWFKPERYDQGTRYPLIVYLHGSRDTVSHDLHWYQPAIQQQSPCFVLTPKCENPDQGWGNTWNEGHPPAMSQTLALIDSLVKVYPIDPNRLYIYGISM